MTTITTTTREDIRRKLAAIAEREIVGQITAAAELTEDSDAVEASIGAGGSFEYVEQATVEVVLEDDAALGWHVEKPGYFTGSVDGHAWEGDVTKHCRKGRILTLTIDISPAD